MLAQPRTVVGQLLDRTTDMRPCYRCGMLIVYPYEVSTFLSQNTVLQAQQSNKNCRGQVLNHNGCPRMAENKERHRSADVGNVAGTFQHMPIASVSQKKAHEL